MTSSRRSRSCARWRIQAREMRDVRCARSALVADALPHADRRRQPDRAAAEVNLIVSRSGARRCAMARNRSHECMDGARLAVGARRHAGAADAAGDRARNRRRQHARSARRQLLRRAADGRIEEEVYAYFERINDFGGVIRRSRRASSAGDRGSAARFRPRSRRASGNRRRERLRGGQPLRIPILEMDPQGYERQVARLEELRATRDAGTVARSLDALCQAARHREPDALHLDAACADATRRRSWTCAGVRHLPGEA